jgi:hypothetical protein
LPFWFLLQPKIMNINKIESMDLWLFLAIAIPAEVRNRNKKIHGRRERMPWPF